MTPIRLGASYFNGCPIPFPEFLGMCQELGLEHIEIQLEPPITPPDIDHTTKTTILDSLGSASVIPTTHAPYDDINLSSFKERIRRASLDILKECVDFTVEIGASILVVHGGSCSINQISKHDNAIQRFRASLLELAMYAHDRGVRIGLENKQIGLDREVILFPDEHHEVVHEFADFDVGAVIDVGHANTAGIALGEYFEQMQSYLIEVHLHDNNGTSDEHMTLGNGTIDFKSVLNMLDRIQFDGPVILELDTREDLESAIAFIESNS